MSIHTVSVTSDGKFCTKFVAEGSAINSRFLESFRPMFLIVCCGAKQLVKTSLDCVIMMPSSCDVTECFRPQGNTSHENFLMSFFRKLFCCCCAQSEEYRHHVLLPTEEEPQSIKQFLSNYITSPLHYIIIISECVCDCLIN